ncbi:hypothetical protein ACWEOW_16615 [Monashia sp. NPDC004114]
MNLTDLREELALLADDLQPAPAELSTGVARKVARTKRRRAVGAAAAACAALVVTGVAVAGSLGRPAAPVVPAAPVSSGPMLGADGMPFRAVPQSRGDVVRDGLRYRATVADNHLAVASIGERGQSSVTLTWTPTTTRMALTADCWLPGVDDRTAQRAWAYFVLDGRRLFGSSCASATPSGDLPSSTATPEPGKGWPELTVGRPVTVSVVVVDQKTNQPVTAPSLRVAGAAYDLGEQVEVVDPTTGAVVAELPRVREYGGYLYRLDGQVSVASFRPRQWIVEATPANAPFLVTYGSAGVGGGDVGTDRLKGLSSDSGANSSGGQATTPQPAWPAHTVELVHEGPLPRSGVMLLAIYTLVP